MSRWSVLIALAAGCYAPAATTGAPCGPGDTCPTGQECRAAVCVAVGSPHDASATADTLLADAAAPDTPAYVPWGTPAQLAISGLGGESDPSMTADGLTVVFAADPVDGDDQIYIATRPSPTGSFTVTELAALNSTTTDDKSPEISPDGSTIYFTSDRTGNFDVYMSTLSDGVWSAPVVRSDLSTAGNEGDVAISPDGLTAIVVASDGTNRFRIHTRATTAEPFGAGVIHPELQVASEIAAPTLTNGAQVVYFHAGDVRQIYVAHRKPDGTFATPTPVSELNVPGTRFAAPFVVQSDDHMVFERNSQAYEVRR